MIIRVLRLLLLKFAVRLATSREVPDAPNSYDKRNNFTYFWITHSTFEREKFLPTKPSEAKGMVGAILPLEGSRWPNPQMKDACLPYRQIGGASFEIHRQYGLYHATFKSPLIYILSEAFRYVALVAWITEARETRAQKRFSEQFQVSAERMDVLQKILEWRREISKKQSGQVDIKQDFDAFDLANHLFSHRFWGLEQQDYYLDELEFILESLVATNDLEQKNGRFLLTSNTVTTISAFEEERSKFVKADNHDQTIRRLTLVIAITAVLQLFISVC